MEDGIAFRAGGKEYHAGLGAELDGETGDEVHADADLSAPSAAPSAVTNAAWLLHSSPRRGSVPDCRPSGWLATNSLPTSSETPPFSVLRFMSGQDVSQEVTAGKTMRRIHRRPRGLEGVLVLPAQALTARNSRGYKTVFLTPPKLRSPDYSGVRFLQCRLRFHLRGRETGEAS